jgi:hypothetical protein
MATKKALSLLEYLSSPSPTLPPIQPATRAIREILRLLNNPERGGGVTYSLYFGDQWAEPFYAVGLSNDLTCFVDIDEVEETVTRFIRTYRKLLTHPRCCLGIWQAADADGIEKLWLDVSVLIYREEIAHAFATEGNQIALYDLRHNGRGEIPVGGTGESMWERLTRLERQDRIGRS